MSRFENYTSTSENYDLTRRPAAMELILGALAMGSRPLAEQVVLDAGCGTGNYVAALAGRVARIQGVELNPGMLAAARAKFSGQPDVQLHEGSILELPIESGSCNGVMVNFVLHHLEEGADVSFAATRRAIAECRRVLAPGGTLIVQTCSPEQYRHGYWYSELMQLQQKALMPTKTW
jgi:ubiquinone/menaquinone biosynthesis C-methylase UbiE